MDPNLGRFLLSMVVLIPFISGLLRLKKMSGLYRPFLMMLAAAIVAEIVNYISINYTRNNSATINIYSLVECLLIIAQFYYWRLYSRTRRWYPYFGALCIAIWITENFFIRNMMTEVAAVFRISAAFVLVVLSVNEINYLIINDNRSMLKNARFLICTGFLIFFLYQILLEGAIFVLHQQKSAMARQIIQLSLYINIIVNLIYGIAVWFIPKRISLSFKQNVKM